VSKVSDEISCFTSGVFHFAQRHINPLNQVRRELPYVVQIRHFNFAVAVVWRVIQGSGVLEMRFVLFSMTCVLAVAMCSEDVQAGRKARCNAYQACGVSNSGGCASSCGGCGAVSDCGVCDGGGCGTSSCGVSSSSCGTSSCGGTWETVEDTIMVPQTVMQTKTITVNVPTQEQRQGSRTVSKTVYDTQEESYTVCVQKQETREIQVPVTTQVAQTVSRQVYQPGCSTGGCSTGGCGSVDGGCGTSSCGTSSCGCN